MFEDPTFRLCEIEVLGNIQKFSQIQDFLCYNFCDRIFATFPEDNADDTPKLYALSEITFFLGH